jgi:large subunit ribosomal protein L3
MAAIIGRKLGMTQIFAEDGKRVTVTVIEAGPCPVTQVKTPASDGYSAVQLAFGATTPKHVSKPEIGHLQKSGAAPHRHLVEFPMDELGGEVAVGDVVTVESFSSGQYVRVTGTSKGKGYAGTIKRHNFKRGPVTHGSHNVRAPGSIGAAAYPARVMKGVRMSGRMGGDRVTQRGLQIIDRDPERNLLLVQGSVPGGVNGIVIVRPE